MKYVITRPIEGVSINGREYLLDENDRVIQFDSKDEARTYLHDHNISDQDMDDAMIEIIEDEQRCRVCGCTWNNACVTENGPCHWVEEVLCSACVGKEGRT